MTDEQVEKIIKSNMMLQMNLAGIKADFEEALQRTWVGLTDEEIQDALEAEFLGCDAKRNWQDDLRVARAIEAAHGIKGEA